MNLTVTKADHTSMVKKFEAAMSKLAVLGHNARTLVDCSEVIPAPAVAKAQTAMLPAGKTNADIQGAVRESTPSLQTPY